MELDRIADLPAPVDEEEVQAAILAWLNQPSPGMADNRPAWRIRSLAAADWAMDTVAEVDRRVNEYDDHIRELNRARNRVAQASVFLRSRLEEWAIEQRTAKLKTHVLGSGSVATRESPRRIEVTDGPTVLEWARVHAPEAIETTERFLKSQVPEGAWRMVLRAVDSEGTVYERSSPLPPDSPLQAIGWVVLGADGEEVPGVEVVPVRVTAKVVTL